ncbi:MAG: hypothetical protein D6720_12600 [Gammaproteobacteria bacterium]|nr:MAG: hypothetical protein D6720_12600 [Gammaproteobacteria bacterium]
MRRLRWMLPLLLVVGVLPAAAAWLLGSTAGARWAFTDLGPRLVPGLAVEGVNGTLWRGLSIEGLRYVDATGLRVEIDDLSWRWQPAGLRQRLLVIPKLSAARVEVTAGKGGSGDGSPWSGLALPLAIELTEARIDRFEWMGEQGTPLVFEGLRAGLHLDRRLRIRFLQGGLIDPRVTARLSGEVGLDRPSLPLRLAVEWQARMSLEEKPVVLVGKGELHGDMIRLELEHHLSAPFALSTRGQIRALRGDRPSLDLAGAWERLQWPLAGTSQVASPAGSYRISGPLERLALQLGAKLEAPDAPPIEAALTGRWEAGRLHLAPLDLTSKAGRLRLQGTLDLRQTPRWSVEMTGSDLGPAPLASDWPGRLSLRATSRGRVVAEGVAASVTLQSLDGELRGYPFAASGDIEIDGRHVELRGLRLQSGSAKLSADGQVGPTLGLRVSGDVPDLQTLLPAASGRLRFRGEASGALTGPRIALHLEGQDVVREDLRFGTLLADIDWRPPGQGDGNSKIAIMDLAAGGARWRRVQLELQGRPENHRLQLVTAGGPVNVEARLSGAWQAQRWQGRVERLVVDERQLGRWSTDRPASLAVSADAATLERLCLAPDRPPCGEVCAEGGWHVRNGLAVTGRVSRMDLRRFGALLPEDLAVAGRLGADFSIEGPTRAPAVQARARLPSGSLTLREVGEKPIRLALSEATANLRYGPGGLQASASLRLQDKGHMELRLDGTPEGNTGVLRLQGQVDASLPDLALLTPLVPQARIRSGTMSLNARIGGTSQAPRVIGRLEVADGGLDYPRLGLAVRQLRLKLEGGEDGRLRLKGSARSGPGTLHLSGEGSIDPRAPWQLRIDGERVQLVRLPDARVLASPALRLSGGAQGIEVAGRVEVPEADITLRELPEGVARPSGDEVIVGPAAHQVDGSRPAPVNLSGEVELVLGQKVHFAGFGLKTRVAGRLLVALAAGQTKVQGKLDLLEGRYRAWGQDLSIEQGRLLFAGPPDNPGIDLRALRVSKDGQVKAYLAVTGTLRKPATRVYTEPPTSSTDALAYLLNGAPMGQSKGIDQAQLLKAAGSLGLSKTLPLLKKIKQQTGLDELGLADDTGLQGSAVAVGKYLTPDLYVRYVQGLFDPASVLSLRYRIGRHLSVETRSGTTQSAELIYSIEHD